FSVNYTQSPAAVDYDPQGDLVCGVGQTPTTDADTLCGQSCDYYLWRPNQKGSQPITTISGLQETLSNLYNFTTIDASNVTGDGIGVYYERDGSILYFKKIKGGYNVSVTDDSGIITISTDACLGEYVKEASLGPVFIWDEGLLDVSISDASLNELYSWVGGVTYDSSVFIEDDQSYQTTISALDQMLGLLAPAKPDYLTGKTLSDNVSTFSAILPTGLSSDWYIDASPGDTISSYSIDDSFILTTPSYSDTFYAGTWNDTATRGL
ncbi:unnamed protein product, partial [marine sediment metagenome]